MAAKRPFVVGRTTGRGTLVVVVRDAPPPIEGPFTLRAVITPVPRERGAQASP